MNFLLRLRLALLSCGASSDNSPWLLTTSPAGPQRRVCLIGAMGFFALAPGAAAVALPGCRQGGRPAAVWR